MENLVSNTIVTQNKEDSLVTSVPTGYQEPKLQQ